METQKEKEGGTEREGERERKKIERSFANVLSAFATERSMFIFGLWIHCDS